MGVGTFVASQPTVLIALTIVGSLYLLWIGIRLSLHPATISNENKLTIEANKAWWNWVVKGFGVSGMNPKVFLLFLALLPQFIHSSASLSVTTQIISLGLIHILSCTVIYMLVGFSAQILLKTRPRAAQIVSQISGGLMVLIAIILMIDQVKYFSFG